MAKLFKVIDLELYKQLMASNPCNANITTKMNHELSPPQINILTNQGISKEKILACLADLQRKKASRLLEFMNQRLNTLNWNELGEISYKGNEIKRSHIIDLLSAATRSLKSKRKIVGINTFLTALCKVNAPKDLFGAWFWRLYDLNDSCRSGETLEELEKFKGSNWISYEKIASKNDWAFSCVCISLELFKNS